MDQLWGIALRAQNTDVSLTAIQYLNAHYISCKLYRYTFDSLSMAHNTYFYLSPSTKHN